MEADSPRGRIYQVLQVDAGRLKIGASFALHIDRCLGCLACETACPSGVHYGRILERARAEVEQNYRRPKLASLVRRHFYSKVLRDQGSLARWGRLLRWYQRSGLQRLARASGVLKLLGLARVEALAPTVESRFFFGEFGRVYPAESERRATVALLAGCVASVAFAELNRATIRVLTRNGVEVHVPPEQGCCGALHAHAGYLAEAREQARRNIDAMSRPEFDAVITNSAGCGSTMKDYADLLAADPTYASTARQFTPKVKDVTEYLAELGLRPPARPLGRRVTYQDACHLAHAQRIRTAPHELLKAIGAELVEMPHSDYCCGSAGTYNVTQTGLSMKILAAKLDDISTVQPEVIATANTGCMLQLRAGVSQRGMRADVRHVVELVDEAYQQ